jgi:Spy/CpxP family protein refolding chaperone
MKKIVLIVAMFCLTGIGSGVFAQQRLSEEERRAQFEKFNAEREEFISKAMKLTDDEKKAFWPLCNELQMKKFELNRNLRDEMRKIMRAQRENQTVSEADYKKVIELGARVKVQEAQLEQEYLAKFLKVIPAEKVFLYRQSEQNFGERMIREGGPNRAGPQRGM